ncbi:uncharacterized protein SOCE26_048260 [Sorangium cellulosum]|uniref:EGF-like domain-containing protein n=1 Tax=Sorangium cellulosum TaxID=56 RepID=A0A2L0EVP6_SORCE|nr:hypothetical protein [Sorangium cellulosum]AUX43378.1 uncharacterized protein SOCE26_048260 [Sorangium cellulosum]
MLRALMRTIAVGIAAVVAGCVAGAQDDAADESFVEEIASHDEALVYCSTDCDCGGRQYVCVAGVCHADFGPYPECRCDAQCAMGQTCVNGGCQGTPTAICHCEHYGSPFDDICEAYPQGGQYEYYFEPIGDAVIWSSSIDNPGAHYACPHHSSRPCMITVTVVGPTGSSSALCHGH